MITAQEISSLTLQTLHLILWGSAPAIIAAGVAGLIISLLQALTQVQDQGLPTAVKFFAVIGAVALTYLMVTNDLMNFTSGIFDQIARL